MQICIIERLTVVALYSPTMTDLKCPWCGRDVFPKDEIDFEAFIGEAEKHLITEALAQTGDNQTAAAKLLKIPKHTIRWYIEKHGLGKKKSHLPKEKSHIPKKAS
jgi:transcriptional regulator with GAF, ATPase, and Fis domain